MKVRTLFILLILVAVAAFSALNWSAFMTPTTLSLGLAVVQAPLGLIMLGLLVFLTALFLVFVVYLQTSLLIETRRHARELKAQRSLAEQAEASRFTELRGLLDTELKRLASLDADSKAALLTRLDQLDQDLRSVLEQSVNTVTAQLGELDDRLERKSQGQLPRPPA